MKQIIAEKKIVLCIKIVNVATFHMSTVHCAHFWLTFAGCERSRLYMCVCIVQNEKCMNRIYLSCVRLLLLLFNTFALVPFLVKNSYQSINIYFRSAARARKYLFWKWFCSIFVGLARNRLAFGIGSEDLLIKLVKINIKIEHTLLFAMATFSQPFRECWCVCTTFTHYIGSCKCQTGVGYYSVASMS